MTQTIKLMVGGMTPDEALLAATAAQTAADIARDLPGRGVVALTCYLLASEVSRRHGTPTPDFGETLARCAPRELLTLLCVATAMQRADESPFPAVVHALFAELATTIEAARVAGGHTLTRSYERRIDELLTTRMTSGDTA
jgi:hypothetical protein